MYIWEQSDTNEGFKDADLRAMQKGPAQTRANTWTEVNKGSKQGFACLGVYLAIFGRDCMSVERC